MKGFDLLAAHMVGDYILQTNEEAIGKFDSPLLLAKHVAKYTLAQAVVGVVHGRSRKRICAFVILGFLAHYITDSRRWASGEDWLPKPMMVDQALHAVQLSILGRVL